MWYINVNVLASNYDAQSTSQTNPSQDKVLNPQENKPFVS